MERILQSYCHLLGKTRESLRRGLAKLEEVKMGLSRLGVCHKGRRYNQEWVEAMQLVNQVIVAEMVMRAALMREESRGLHFREDYPQPDKAWEKNIVIVCGERGMQLAARDVEFTYLTPEEGERSGG